MRRKNSFNFGKPLLYVLIALIIILILIINRKENAGLLGIFGSSTKKKDELQIHKSPITIQGIEFTPITNVRTHSWVSSPFGTEWRLKGHHLHIVASGEEPEWVYQSGPLSFHTTNFIGDEGPDSGFMYRGEAPPDLKDYHTFSVRTDGLDFETVKNDSFAFHLTGSPSRWIRAIIPMRIDGNGREVPAPWTALKPIPTTSTTTVNEKGSTYLAPYYFSHWLSHKTGTKEYLIPYWFPPGDNKPRYMALGTNWISLATSVDHSNLLCFEIEHV